MHNKHRVGVLSGLYVDIMELRPLYSLWMRHLTPRHDRLNSVANRGRGQTSSRRVAVCETLYAILGRLASLEEAPYENN